MTASTAVDIRFVLLLILLMVVHGFLYLQIQEDVHGRADIIYDDQVTQLQKTLLFLFDLLRVFNRLCFMRISIFRPRMVFQLLLHAHVKLDYGSLQKIVLDLLSAFGPLGVVKLRGDVEFGLLLIGFSYGIHLIKCCGSL